MTTKLQALHRVARQYSRDAHGRFAAAGVAAHGATVDAAHQQVAHAAIDAGLRFAHAPNIPLEIAATGLAAAGAVAGVRAIANKFKGDAKKAEADCKKPLTAERAHGSEEKGMLDQVKGFVQSEAFQTLVIGKAIGFGVTQGLAHGLGLDPHAAAYTGAMVAAATAPYAKEGLSRLTALARKRQHATA